MIEPSRPDAHLSTVPSVRTTCHTVRTLDRPASSVRMKCSFCPDPILYREVYVPACIRSDVSASRLDASQYSISFWFLSKFQEREDQSTVRTMWYPVQTRVSLRQESQFKYDRPDVWQLWFGRACIKEGNCLFDFNRLDDCLSWSWRAYYRYGNCVLKNSRPDAHPLGPDAREPYKEITWSGRATVRTMCHPVRTIPLNRKDFPANFLENLVVQLSTVRTVPKYILSDAHLSPQPINRGPWTQRTLRIRCEFH
jgi:hypothetical protein